MPTTKYYVDAPGVKWGSIEDRLTTLDEAERAALALVTSRATRKAVVVTQEGLRVLTFYRQRDDAVTIEVNS